MRPKSLEEFVGQAHLVGPSGVLVGAIKAGNLPSMILWGPPGVGKTTLANLIADSTQRRFVSLSAIDAGIRELRAVIEQAKSFGPTLLFIDEIHRFNKTQQDALLQAVEKGTLTLVGATTENPSFEVNAALLSRCQVYVLKELERKELDEILRHAVQNDSLLAALNITLKETDALIDYAGGDARRLLNALELTADNLPASSGELVVTNTAASEVLGRRASRYDKGGDQHYDLISAFIKSLKGSDPNAALYWMARMLDGGEQPEFIARRILVASSEEVGNANPNALLLANAAFDAVKKIGLPEARIILAQAVTYIASSPKSNASYVAINQAMDASRRFGDLPVPIHLRNAPTKLMKNQGYGKDYKYAHAFEGNFVHQEYLPENLSGTKFYDPGSSQREQEIRRWLKDKWQAKYDY